MKKGPKIREEDVQEMYYGPSLRSRDEGCGGKKRENILGSKAS